MYSSLQACSKTEHAVAPTETLREADWWELSSDDGLQTRPDQNTAREAGSKHRKGRSRVLLEEVEMNE